MDYRREAKVVLVDLEVSPSLSWNYGQYQTNAIKVEQPPILLSFAWKWLGEGKVHSKSIVDMALPDKMDHSLLVKELWKLFDEANVVVTHNVAFDVKMANAFFLRCGLNPPSPYKTFCTLKTARKYFKLDNNKLDYLGNLLFGEGKTEITNADTWYGVLFGSDKERKRCNRLLKLYNENDVILLEKIYERLLAYADNHPNMALCAGQYHICPKCGREASFRVKAYRRSGLQITGLQYECSECHGYVTRKLTTEEKEELAMDGRLIAKYRNIGA